jgi:hypothetical protein
MNLSMPVEEPPRTVARQRDGATVSPVAWGQARSISDDVEMMACGPVGVKWVGAVGGVER